MRFSKENLWVNLALFAIKTIVGIFAGSRALLAAGLYSINDILSAIIVLISLKVGKRPPDDDHSYGHGKAEFVAIAIMSFVLAVGVCLLVYFSLADIVRGVVGPPHVIAIGVAVISLIANGLLAKRGVCSARFHKSLSLHTSAEHNRADAYSSAAVLIGVGGAALGFHVLDQIVALFEAGHVLWLGGTLLGKSLKGLMDTALPPEDEEALIEAAREVEGVIGVESLKTRQVGTHVWVDIVVAVEASYSVAEAREICRRVNMTLRRYRGRELKINVGFRPATEGKATPGEIGRVSVSEASYAQ